jgi:hypothetical protein
MRGMPAKGCGLTMLPDKYDIDGMSKQQQMEYRALLENAQWGGDGVRCLYCGSTKAVGVHTTTCELGIMLDSLK